MYKQILRDRFPNQPKARLVERYIRMIEEWNNSTNVNTQKHHILPKSVYLYPEYSNLRHHRWNQANLSYRQHFLVHWVLAKLFGHGQWMAFTRMRTGRNDSILNSSLYALSREHFKKAQSEILKGKIAVNHELNSLTCVYILKKDLDDYIQQGWKMGGGTKGQKKSYAMEWFHHPITKEIFRGAEEHKPEKFVSGRGDSSLSDHLNQGEPPHNVGKVCFNDGEENIYISIDDEIPKGFSIGGKEKIINKTTCECGRVIANFNLKRHQKVCKKMKEMNV